MPKADKKSLVDSEAGDHEKDGCCTNGYYDHFVRPLVAEFIGSVIYIFVAGMTVLTANVGLIAAAQGLVILVMAVAFAPVSGAHFNPAVTLAVLVSGNISPVKALLYVIFQLLGSVGGAGLVRGLGDSSDYILFSGGAPMIGATTDIPAALGIEIVLSFVLVLVFLIAQVDQENALAPFAHGFVYLAGLLFAVPLTGGVINPIRSFGLSVVYSSETADHWKEQWMYYVAAAIGSIVAAVVYKLSLATEEKRWNCSEGKKSD